MSRKSIRSKIVAAFWSAWRILSPRRLLWGLLFFLLTVVVVGVNQMPENQVLEVGQRSPKEFRDSRGLTFVSEILTQQAREEAARQVKPSYKVDPTVLAELERDTAAYYQRVRDVLASEGEAAYKERTLRETLGLTNRNAAEILQILGTDPSGLDRAQRETLRQLRLSLNDGVQSQALEAARAAMLLGVRNSGLEPTLASLSETILQKLDLRTNLIYDPVATVREVNRAREGVPPVQRIVRANELIASKGEPLTAAQIEVLQRLGMLRSRAPYLPLLGVSLLVALMEALILFYLYQYRREVFREERFNVLLGLLVVFTLLLALVVTAIIPDRQPEIASQMGYLVPLATGSMLIAILLDSRLAIFATMLMALLTGVIAGKQLSIAAVAAIGGLVGVYAITHLNQRNDLAKSSLYLVGANLVSIAAFGLLSGSTPLAILWGLLMGAINGILSTVLTLGTLPFLETAFGITTSVRLLELSNPNQPLLKRLLLEAPGTYHHSIMVGNLAEAAADAVGANSLLARVGAYYHDVGKVKRPYFFIENQALENPHDKLAPSLSTLIITSHIKDGIDLAKEQKLPPVVVEVIAQHHGTSLLSYFFNKAMDSDRCETLSEEDFRYESSKPRTKEAAIVMLSDAVEAGVRSLQRPSPGRMEGFVRRLIKEKLEDGQLENCDLTFRELEVIAQSFVHILNGIFHTRIEYPDNVVREMEKRKAKDADLRAKPAG